MIAWILLVVAVLVIVVLLLRLRVVTYEKDAYKEMLKDEMIIPDD